MARKINHENFNNKICINIIFKKPVSRYIDKVTFELTSYELNIAYI